MLKGQPKNISVALKPTRWHATISKNAWWFAFLNDPQTFAMVDGRNGPRLAQIGHGDGAERCPNPGVKRTIARRLPNVEKQDTPRMAEQVGLTQLVGSWRLVSVGATYTDTKERIEFYGPHPRATWL
jgi:hypothetical protein